MAKFNFSWFKFSWFGSKEREALHKMNESLQKIEKSLSEAAVTKNIVEPSKSVEPSDKPFKNIIYSNSNMTVVFPDGTVLDKMNVDKDFFNKVRECKDQKEIEEMMTDTSVPEVKKQEETIEDTEEERQLIADNLGVLRNHKDFTISNGTVMLKGVNLAIPPVVLASFIEVLEKLEEALKDGEYAEVSAHDYFDQYQALKMFWLKLALNPLPQSRKDLLTFCKKNDVRITNNGNLILYRKIVTKGGADTKYISFISQTYYSLKKKGDDVRMYAVGQKAKGAYYFVDLREDKYVVDELLGNLYHLYQELPKYETNTYTAWHDNSVSIKIGGIYKIDDNKINLNNTICAAGGLHAAAVDYNYSGFGDVAVVVLVNPCKAITVPLYETGKLRTTEMFVACVNDKPLGQHFDDAALTVFDEEYHDLTLDELEAAASNKNYDGLKVCENLPAIELVDLTTIADLLKGRIKDII